MPSQILILPPKMALPLPSSCSYCSPPFLLPYQKTKIKITTVKTNKHAPSVISHNRITPCCPAPFYILLLGGKQEEESLDQWFGVKDSVLNGVGRTRALIFGRLPWGIECALRNESHRGINASQSSCAQGQGLSSGHILLIRSYPQAYQIRLSEAEAFALLNTSCQT